MLGLDAELLPLRCLGALVVDGINAVPLVRDAAGGRSSNVEADMLLLLTGEDGLRQVLIEAKASSNNAWYAPSSSCVSYGSSSTVPQPGGSSVCAAR
jgi:hypothetical protein